MKPVPDLFAFHRVNGSPFHPKQLQLSWYGLEYRVQQYRECTRPQKGLTFPIRQPHQNVQNLALDPRGKRIENRGVVGTTLL